MPILAFGTTPPTSPTVGTGIFINKTGLYGLNANTQNFKIDATTIYYGDCGNHWRMGYKR